VWIYYPEESLGKRFKRTGALTTIFRAYHGAAVLTSEGDVLVSGVCHMVAVSRGCGEKARGEGVRAYASLCQQLYAATTLPDEQRECRACRRTAQVGTSY
jgi:hypothetical protein